MISVNLRGYMYLPFFSLEKKISNILVLVSLIIIHIKAYLEYEDEQTPKLPFLLLYQ